MNSPFDTDTEHQINAVALSMVGCERLRQVSEKDYRCSHDDTLQEEELGAAAAYFLLPAWIDQQVAYVDTNAQLDTQLLFDLLADATFDTVNRSDQPGDIQTPEGLDRRIEMVVKGCALGVAELERLLRIREVLDRKEA